MSIDFKSMTIEKKDLKEGKNKFVDWDQAKNDI